MTDGPGDKLHPRVSGRWVVWEDTRNGNHDLYGYDLGPDGVPFTHDDANEGEHPLVIAPGDSTDFDIDGHLVVYRDNRTGDFDIHLYDLARGLEWRITSDPSNELEPDVFGDTIIWTDARSGNNDIRMYKLGPDLTPFTGDDPREGEYGVASTAASECSADIYGERVAYSYTNLAPGYSEDIYVYDLGPDGVPGTGDAGEGTRPVAVHPEVQMNPQIYGDAVVWYDRRDGEIHLGNLTTGSESALFLATGLEPVSFDGALIAAQHGHVVALYDLRTDAGPIAPELFP